MRHGHADVPSDESTEVHPGRYPDAGLSRNDSVLGQLLVSSITGTEADGIEHQTDKQAHFRMHACTCMQKRASNANA